MDSRILNVIDQEGNIVREATREEIHKNGLLHAEVHVLFYTPDRKVIFQHRAKDKDTYPDLLDATVGGHVEPGDTYEETALKEAGEEVGISVDPKSLIPLRTVITKSYDEVTGTINHPRLSIYAYRYEGALEDLRIEEGKAIGFEAWSIDKLFALTIDEQKKFIPLLIGDIYIDIYKQIQDLI